MIRLMRSSSIVSVSFSLRVLHPDEVLKSLAATFDSFSSFTCAAISLSVPIRPRARCHGAYPAPVRWKQNRRLRATNCKTKRGRGNPMAHTPFVPKWGLRYWRSCGQSPLYIGLRVPHFCSTTNFMLTTRDC